MHKGQDQVNFVEVYQLYIKPDFPSLADDLAEPRPDMNIKVAAFTVSEKSINTYIYTCSHCHPVGNPCAYTKWACREKTCLRGFRQSETQTSLISYRD